MLEPSTSLMYSPMILTTRSRSSNFHQRESLKRKPDSSCSGYIPPRKRFKQGKPCLAARTTDKPTGADHTVEKFRNSHFRKRHFLNQGCGPDDQIQELSIPNKRCRKIQTSPTTSAIHPDMDFSLNFNCTTADSNYLTRQVSPAMQSPEFSSFAYFQPVIPDLDLEINQFLEDSTSDSAMSEDISEKKSEDPNFNSFNYWRVPIPVVDLDML